MRLGVGPPGGLDPRSGLGQPRRGRRARVRALRGRGAPVGGLLRAPALAGQGLPGALGLGCAGEGLLVGRLEAAAQHRQEGVQQGRRAAPGRGARADVGRGGLHVHHPQQEAAAGVGIELGDPRRIEREGQGLRDRGRLGFELAGAHLAGVLDAVDHGRHPRPPGPAVDQLGVVLLQAHPRALPEQREAQRLGDAALAGAIRPADELHRRGELDPGPGDPEEPLDVELLELHRRALTRSTSRRPRPGPRPDRPAGAARARRAGVPGAACCPGGCGTAPDR